jgi:hypothetical protein
MKLPEHFSFNQQNLQDYQDCPRRFYLRHILKQAWPAIESEPVREQEALIDLGERFHRLVQQMFAGVPEANLTASIDDEPELATWWSQFKRLALSDLPGEKFSETAFSMPYENSRLTAKFDFLLYQPGQQALIYDWKTSQKMPKENWLSKRLQTRVYPLVLATLAGSPNAKFLLSPEQIKMIYWYPAFPEAPIEFDYSAKQFEEDSQFLRSLTQEIQRLDEASFTKTENERLCKFCQYRSLCDRGVNAGDLADSEEPVQDLASAFDFDFDQLTAAD